MSVTVAPIAGGTTGALADANVAIDRIASADYQLTKLTDPTVGVTTPIGVAANPLKTKPFRRGSSDYDSGLVAVTTVLTSVTTATIYPEDGFISNNSAAEHSITITDTVGNVHIDQLALGPRSRIPWPIPIAMVGLKVQADANSAVVCGVRGAQ